MVQPAKAGVPVPHPLRTGNVSEFSECQNDLQHSAPSITDLSQTELNSVWRDGIKQLKQPGFPIESTQFPLVGQPPFSMIGLRVRDVATKSRSAKLRIYSPAPPETADGRESWNGIDTTVSNNLRFIGLSQGDFLLVLSIHS